jgi:Putative Ig domain/Cep192 domain 4/Abnormal spindle-like microcephaly-assoc'd, ASPM-SPD-2-Hydin
MKSIVRAMIIVSCLISAAMLSKCGGRSSQQFPQLTITTASLPNGTLETPYSQTIQASGGVAPFTWTVSAGGLPHNVALSSSTTNTETISGTPDTPAQGVAFTIKVTDSANQSATQSYTVSILLEPDTLTLAPSSLSFGLQLVGTVSSAQQETVTNTGTSAVVISSIALTGTNAADFTQSSTCDSNVAAGANCTINVTFTPSQLGPRSASITITDNTMGSPHSVSLSGAGLTAGPNATLSATSLAFGDQVVGTTSAAQSITLSNYGTTTLSIASIAASTNFAETTTCSSTLASGASCTISVTFTPSNTGSVNGTLAVADTAADSPQIVSISGTGVGGRCGHQGEQCWPGHPCCSGLTCRKLGLRAFCEP